MDKIMTHFYSVPNWVYSLVSMPFLFVLFYFFNRVRKPKVLTEMEVWKRAREVSIVTWVFQSFQDSDFDGLYLFVKSNHFPYVGEVIYIPESHPDYDFFSSLRHLDFVRFVFVESVEQGLSPQNISTYLRRDNNFVF